MCSKHGDYRCIINCLSTENWMEKQTSSSDDIMTIGSMLTKNYPRIRMANPKFKYENETHSKKHNDTHTLLFSQNSDVVFFGVSKPNFNNIATYLRQ